MDGSPLIAVDTNVLLDQALADRHVTDALDTIRERLKSPRILVPPTVLHELALQVRQDRTEEMREAATDALTGMLARGYEPVNATPVGHGVVEQIGLKLRLRGIIPEREVNDGFIVAEAALFGCSILLSSDGHMTNADAGALHRLLADCDAPGDKLVIAGPREIVAKFFRRR